jgi:4-amino-4-deoxy-L-arabinose transferase-like glycosyltransferase
MFAEKNFLRSDLLSARARAAFWIIGICSAVLLTYTTRYYINGDAIAYVEIGEALRRGHWWGLANLTYSPGYPALLTFAQIVFHTTPLTEIQILKVVNFLAFVMSMASCDLLMRRVKRELDKFHEGKDRPLPFPVIAALCYSIFLVAGLRWIAVRTMSPDMLVLCIIVSAAAIILWIRENPRSYFRYVVLGAAMGVGYLVKVFMFPFSAVLFVLAGLASGSLKKALPRVGIAVLIMLIIAAPLVGALSYRMQRFSYGELGQMNYAVWVSGEGEPINKPLLLNDQPRVVLYHYSIPCTQPSGHDICYWQVGLRPKFNFSAQLSVFVTNLKKLSGKMMLLAFFGAWLILTCKFGSFQTGGLRNPSLSTVLLIPAVLGIGLFCLLRIEPRYLAPFIFIGFVGLAAGFMLPEDRPKSRSVVIAASLVLVMFFLAQLGHAVVDQTLRGLRSCVDSPSYREAFMEQMRVKDFLLAHGLSRDDEAATLGLTPPIYWARMAGLRVDGEVNDPENFVNGTKLERACATDALRKASVKVVIAKDTTVGTLASEGWKLVPGTRDYYALLLNQK